MGYKNHVSATLQQSEFNYRSSYIRTVFCQERPPTLAFGLSSPSSYFEQNLCCRDWNTFFEIYEFYKLVCENPMLLRLVECARPTCGLPHSQLSQQTKSTNNVRNKKEFIAGDCFDWQTASIALGSVIVDVSFSPRFQTSTCAGTLKPAASSTNASVVPVAGPKLKI